jgi:hypothetical protein
MDVMDVMDVMDERRSEERGARNGACRKVLAVE